MHLFSESHSTQNFSNGFISFLNIYLRARGPGPGPAKIRILTVATISDLKMDVEDIEETEEERLGRLLEEEAARLTAGDSVPSEVLREWLKWERFRERSQWLPCREHTSKPPGISCASTLEHLYSPSYDSKECLPEVHKL